MKTKLCLVFVPPPPRLFIYLLHEKTEQSVSANFLCCLLINIYCNVCTYVAVHMMDGPRCEGNTADRVLIQRLLYG